MNTAKQIIVTVEPDGSIKIEGKGFVGAECDKAMAAFEKALGQEAKRTNKPEYYGRTGAGNTQRA